MILGFLEEEPLSSYEGETGLEKDLVRAIPPQAHVADPACRRVPSELAWGREASPEVRSEQTPSAQHRDAAVLLLAPGLEAEAA